MREITFDTETTGMDPAQGHKVIEIGCVELIDKTRTGNNFHVYINPLRKVPKAAQAVHGISDEALIGKPVFKEVVKDFIDYIGNAKLIAHNASFDMKFINFELKESGFDILSYERVIDTLVIARNKFPGQKANLDALCNKFSIDLSRRDKHGALLDAELLADVYIELLGGKQNKLVLDCDETSNISLLSSNIKKSRKAFRNPRTFNPTDEELQLHKQFLDNIKNPLWATGG